MEIPGCLWDWVASRMSRCFSQNVVFTQKTDCQANYGYLGSTTWQIFSPKWRKWDCCFKENSRRYLFPMTKFKLPNGNYDFGKLESVMSLTASPHLAFSDEISSNINECDFFWCSIMKCVNTWKFSITQFPYDNEVIKSYTRNLFKVQNRPMNFI